MAYMVENERRRRTQALVAVGLLHGVAIWAIASGFAGGVVHIVRNTLAAQQWRDEVKITPVAPPDIAPPEARPDTRNVETRLVAPRSDVTLAPIDPGIAIHDVITPPITPVDAGLLVQPPRPSPSPSFATRLAAPKSAPGSWVSDRDYPSAAIREEREGVTRFRVTVGVDGRVTGCEITGSSGSPDLDAATCSKVSARARFIPALGGDGMPMVGSYAGAVRWVLP